jgi:hypothetical protein
MRGDRVLRGPSHDKLCRFGKGYTGLGGWGSGAGAIRGQPKY